LIYSKQNKPQTFWVNQKETGTNGNSSQCPVLEKIWRTK
jgi:hypothetical protein